MHHRINGIRSLEQLRAGVEIAGDGECIGVGLIEIFGAGEDANDRQGSNDDGPDKYIFIFHFDYILFYIETSLRRSLRTRPGVLSGKTGPADTGHSRRHW